MSKGPRHRSPSSSGFHKRSRKASATQDQMPAASDVQVYDREGRLVRTEPSKKPLT